MKKAIQLSNELILNDANVTLNTSHVNAIIRGTSFIPSRKPDERKAMADLEALRRKLNLRLHWNLYPNGAPTTSLVSKIIPSTWVPRDYLSKANTAWKKLVEGYSQLLRQCKGRPNVPRQTLEAWHQLLHDPDHFVLRADKGGKLVILARSNYEKEANRQLSDTATYRELTHEEALARVQTSVAERDIIGKELWREGSVSGHEERRLKAWKGQLPALYFQPKVHQEKRPDTGTFKARPISGNVRGHLKPLDVFVAKWTAPLLQLVPGSLQDTRALLIELEKLKDLPQNSILFSVDVEALYPSMDHAESIEAATRFYNEHRQALINKAKTEGTLPPPSTALFEKIITLVLKNHFFHFQEKRWFHQIRGTAMGCSISVYLANCLMYYRTRHLIDSPPPGLRFLARYIDDIVGIFVGDPGEIKPLFQDVRGGGIELTYVIGGQQLEALDVTIFLKDDGRIGTRLYRKPTDGHLFVHWRSSHPLHLKKSIPYAQLLRIKRNCSEEEDYEREATTLLDRFTTRGYPKTVLQQAKRRADEANREDLIRHQPPSKTEDRVTLVADFHPRLAGELKRLCRTAYEEILQDPVVTERLPFLPPPLPPGPPRIAFRAGRSLGAAMGPIFKTASNQPIAAAIPIAAAARYDPINCVSDHVPRLNLLARHSTAPDPRGQQDAPTFRQEAAAPTNWDAPDQNPNQSTQHESRTSPNLAPGPPPAAQQH